MSLAGSAKTDIKLEAVNVYWGTEACRTITFNDDTGSDQSNQIWYYNSMGSDLQTGQKYMIRMLEDFALALAPTIPPDHILLEFKYSAGETATEIADKFTAFFATDYGVKVSNTAGVAIMENSYIGATGDESDYSLAPLLTFTMPVEAKGGSLGATAQGGSTLNMEAQSVDLMSDQTGSLVLGQIYTGSAATIDMELIEMTKARWETVVGSVTGDVHTPAGGTRLVGYGESRLYQNLFDLGGKLILRPISKGADKSEDVIFWKSSPLPSSISFSGQDIQSMSVSFVAYNDKSKPDAISLFAQGDWDQTL